jgi:hypothetical protein
MKEEIKKFLEFNGKTIFFVAVDGQYWIAIKPICRALNVDYVRQFKNLKEDKILSQLLSKQTMVGPDNKFRKHVCLPEFYVYGWIFQIQSQSEELYEYKWECYRVLYNHFHGTITGRKELLSEKVKAQLEIDKCMNTLNPEVAFKLETASKKLRQITQKLRDLDLEVLEEEKTLFESK